MPVYIERALRGELYLLGDIMKKVIVLICVLTAVCLRLYAAGAGIGPPSRWAGLILLLDH